MLFNWLFPVTSLFFSMEMNNSTITQFYTILYFSKFIFLHFLKLQYSWHLLIRDLWPYVDLNVWKIGIEGTKILSIYFIKAVCPKVRPYVHRWT